MSDQRQGAVDPATDEAAALRHTGAAPLRATDPGRVGPYVPLALLGSGGMGRVYLARLADDSPGLIAVKVIRPEYAEDVRFRRRFEREAQVHARIRAPHTPGLLGTGFEDELLWMATEYLPGLDLADAVREDGAVPAAAVWRLVGELGRALADLSAAGIVHRDLKPSNVLLSVRGTHVIDFGISKAADASAITDTGNRVGTPAYMSPEYLRTGHCDTASDVFSMAGTLVYASTGRAPFGDGTGVDVMHRVAFEEPNPEVLGGIAAADPDLGALLTACLAKEPGHRPTPQDLIDAAGPHTGPSVWPEPLAGRVRTRQQAYEVLHRLPVERAARFRPRDHRLNAVPTPPPARLSRPAPPRIAPPAQAEPAERPGLRTRKKQLLAGTAAVTLCALTAGILVLTRQDDPGTSAATPESIAAASPGAAGSQATEPSDGTSADGASGRRAEVVGSQPGVSVSTAHDDPTTAPTTPAAETGSDAPTPTPSPSATPSEAAAPPWATDCTYYSGNGRTRQGDSGKRVLQVQCMLTERGYDLGGAGVDGEFGSATKSAVMGFQSDKGLDADGVVGPETWAALRDTD